MFETIVALATAPIKSALSIIRLSGDDVLDVVSKCCSKDLRDIKERTILYASIVDKGEKVDDVVLLVYKGPKSFTGEDSVEIICHGSPLISKQIVEVCMQNGARMATNGEFSSRAFMHNKIDLVQALNSEPVRLTTLDGRKLAISVDEIISPSTVKIVHGEGMPIFKDEMDVRDLNIKKGDLYIKFDIKFPEYIDPNKKIEITNLLERDE